MIICTNQSFNQPDEHILSHCIHIFKQIIEHTFPQWLLQFCACMPAGVRCVLHETSHRGCLLPDMIIHQVNIHIFRIFIQCKQTLSLTQICFLLPGVSGITRTNAIYLLHMVIPSFHENVWKISAYLISKLLVRPRPWQSLAK